MYEIGKITDKYIANNGVYLQVYIPNINAEEFLDKNGEECGIWLNDNRHITVSQRKKIYSLFADIAEFTGYTPDETKQKMKLKFLISNGREEFSLSNCSLQTASEFIDFLIDFCFVEDIPLSDLGINRTDNVNKFLHLCLKHKKCCVCGRNADEHHDDAIGMGNDRREVDDSEYRKMALCRCHHTERHTIGEERFFKKYHVYGIKYQEPQKYVNLLDIVTLDVYE